jgi:putative ABC transport system ATP-binding protein
MGSVAVRRRPGQGRMVGARVQPGEDPVPDRPRARFLHLTEVMIASTTSNGPNSGRRGAEPGDPVLRARGVTRVYRMGEVDVHALRGVDFELLEGEFLVLLGASGSGKSTLLNILGGLDRPTEGEVRYRDQDLSHAGDRELTEYRRRHVGFIFQFYNLMPSLTARENVGLVTEISHDPMAPEEALEMVGLADRMDHFPSQLSGGEQQRVAVARAVAKRPGLLLCDEPTGALDYRSGVRVLEVIERVNRELGTATAVITHNAPIAEMAHRVVTLHDGQVEKEYRPERRTPASEIRW